MQGVSRGLGFIRAVIGKVVETPMVEEIGFINSLLLFLVREVILGSRKIPWGRSKVFTATTHQMGGR
jgi:hypothetical protein